MGRKNDCQYSILQTSILITFKICILKGGQWFVCNERGTLK